MNSQVHIQLVTAESTRPSPSSSYLDDDDDDGEDDDDDEDGVVWCNGRALVC